MTFLGIDLGTSGIKVILMDDTQTIVASSQQPLNVSRPFDGWSEQNPKDWITATENAIEDLKTQFPQEIAAVEGISLSGQMHGATLLGAGGEVLRPCILWNDTRSSDEAAMLDSQPLFRSVSGNIVFPGFTAPKLLWVRNNEPAIFEKTDKVLLPKDYLRFWLSGDAVSEMSDSAGTSWLDTAKRCWSSELLSATDMQLSQMPSLVEGTEVSAQLKPELAARWGMSKSVVIGGGAGDNAASACGMGVVASGSAFVSLGTSGVLFAANDAYLPKPESAVHTFCHALPETWHQMGVILSATDSLNWYSRVCGRPAAELTAALGASLNGPSDVLFLPYLSGERTPHNDASIRGVFTGLHHGAGQESLTQAVLEGVCFAIGDNLDALRSTGTEIQRVTAVGGGSKSEYWLKLLATVLELPVDCPEEGDFGAAFGASRLALIAANSADPQSVCLPPKIARTIEPETSLVAAYSEAHENFKALYPAIATISQ